MRKFKLLLPVLCAVFFSSCDPSDNDGSPSDTEFTENFGNPASRDFIGQVVDMQNHPLMNATVKIGSITAQTDPNGVFIINGADVYEKFAYITATKPGYILGSRTLVPTASRNSVKIMMIPSTTTQAISTGTVSEVELSSGTKVTFDGAFKDEEGNGYSGSVNVSMFHLMPSDENISSLMPGSLYAQGEDGNEKILNTFGMLHVQLTGSAGQKLQLQTGHKAQIKMKIDDAQLATAPNSIPLWHFDDAAGYWKQDGVATKQGGFYIGEVSHFSWWNCDTFVSVVNLTIKVVHSNGMPVVGAAVGLQIQSTGFSSQYSQLTSSTGMVSGYVAGNQAMTLTISGIGPCNDIYSATIGPFSSDTVLPDIVISSTGASIVTGTLKKCNGNVVENGYVILKNDTGYLQLQPVTNGTFNFGFMGCAGNNIPFSVIGYDNENFQMTEEIDYTYAGTDLNIGDIVACNTASEYITYTIDDNAPVSFLTGFNSVVYESENFFSLSGSNQTGICGIQSWVSTPGVYNQNQVQIYSEGLGLYIPLHSEGANMTYHINNVGAIGEYIDITFSGTYNDTINTVITQRSVTGSAHVIRNQ